MCLLLKDLIKDLKSELSGNFRDSIVWFMEEKSVFDAKHLHNAMKGLGTKESVLIEILCSRTSEEIRRIKTSFKDGKGAICTQ